ncbi:TPA: hypothetical protein ACJ2ZB_004487 [Yersinia enterocolitica]
MTRNKKISYVSGVVIYRNTIKKIIHRLMITTLLTCTASAYGMEIPCHVIDKDGKPNGDTIVVTPYKKMAEIIMSENNRIIVPYYGDADGSGWEYQNEKWDVIIGKPSPSRISVVVFESNNGFGCGGYIDLQ